MDICPPIRLILADDHPLTLLGLTTLLEGEPDFSVVKTVSDGQQALCAVRELIPDILLLDIAMPLLDGYTVLKKLNAEGFAGKVVLHTFQMDDNRLLEAMQWGVRGIVLKSLPPPVLIQALRKVHAGELWLERESVSRALVNTFERDSARREVRESLTPRELEVIKTVAQGLRNQAVAERLHIQEGTVRIHLHNIYEKLGLDGRGALIAFAQRHGLT
jgi:DNA-binding NarL/FixJ family response regulator